MIFRYLVPVVFSLSAAGLAHAQGSTAGSQPQAHTPPAANAPAPPPVAGRMVLGVTVAENEAIALGYRISKLLHADVRNDKNEKIGKIDDFIVKADGTVTLAIVDVGGFLGMGTHRVAIPVDQFTAWKPHLVLPGATKDALKALPEFQYAKEPKHA